VDQKPSIYHYDADGNLFAITEDGKQRALKPEEREKLDKLPKSTGLTARVVTPDENGTSWDTMDNVHEN